MEDGVGRFPPSMATGGAQPRRDHKVFGLFWRLCRQNKPKTFLRGSLAPAQPHVWVRYGQAGQSEPMSNLENARRSHYADLAEPVQFVYLSHTPSHAINRPG